MQRDPKAAHAKYGQSPEMREFMQEFSGLMGSHFEDIAEKEKAEAEKKKKEQEDAMKSDPVYQKIQTDPQVKAALEDPKV